MLTSEAIRVCASRTAASCCSTSSEAVGWQHTLERFLVCMQRDPLAALGLGQQYVVMVPRDRLSQIHPAAVNRASLCPITRALTAEAIHVRPERGSA
jgi:hypothetical protein